LADMITKTRALENVQGVESVEISLNREVLVSTDLRHSLIREEIMKLEKNRMNYPAPIAAPPKG
jgi:copper chaperone CopZ